MFDTMTLTKAFGALCGALLFFLLGGWAADSLYSVRSHGEDGERGYVILADDGADEAEVEEVAEVPFEELYASADPDAGSRLFRQCQACHQLAEGANGVGPTLHAVVDRPKASIPGFNYSDTLMAMSGEVWTPENISNFIANPREYAPGTAMSYAGLRDVEDRANLIAYLATVPE
jgi:cytochrome c